MSKWRLFHFWVNFSSMLYKGTSGEWDLYVYLWSWSLTGVCCRDAGTSRRTLLALAQYNSKCWRSHPRTQHCSTIPFPRERGPPLRAAPGLPNHQQTQSKLLLMPVTCMWISCNYQTANMGSCKTIYALYALKINHALNKTTTIIENTQKFKNLRLVSLYLKKSLHSVETD